MHDMKARCAYADRKDTKLGKQILVSSKDKGHNN